MTTPTLHINGHVATVTLQRPAQANRLQPEDLATIAAHIEAVNAMPEVLVLRLEATGKHFCSGFDINRIGEANTLSFEQLVNAVEEARPVTIAVVQGGVFGGATDLALACDFRLGSPACSLFMPAARLGLHYYQRGLERYVARLGLDTAKRLFLTAETLDAEQMKSCGFLTDLVDADQLAHHADHLASRLGAMAPLALLGMKKHLNAIARGALDATALARDIRRAAQSDDLREGAAAWAQKRTPVFKGC